MFRDESQQVVRKAKAGGSDTTSTTSRAVSRESRRSSTQSPQSVTENSVQMQGTVFDFNADPQQDLMRQMTTRPPSAELSFVPTDFEATCFFLRHNTWPGAFWTNGGNIPDFFDPGGSVSQQTIKASIASVGAAMLSRVIKSQPLKLSAERQYGSALTLMNKALSDNVEAKTNSTLASVLTLALFEVCALAFLRARTY